jgi:excisionase family DNA binding protein
VHTALLSAPSELLSRDEAAAYLGVKPQTLAVWHTTHRYSIPLVKVGSKVRYRRADLDAWLASRTIGGESDNQAQ